MIYKITYLGFNPLKVFAECKQSAAREAKEHLHAWGLKAKGKPKIQEIEGDI